jgi:hypothetical protein
MPPSIPLFEKHWAIRSVKQVGQIDPRDFDEAKDDFGGNGDALFIIKPGSHRYPVKVADGIDVITVNLKANRLDPSRQGLVAG